MKVEPDSLGAVELALAEYLERPVFGDAAFAVQHQALPLYAGWTGTTYLTTSGQFWYRNHEYDPPRIENDLNESSKLVALALAAERHPGLAVLLPSRPVAATTCEQCDGRGQITLGNASNIICGTCSALGWVPPASQVSDKEPSYPTFSNALAAFQSFAAAHGMPSEIEFLTGEHSLLAGDYLYATVDAFQSHVLARQQYERGVGCRMGVGIGAAGQLPNGKLAIWVYGAKTENELERLMYPRGLKLMVPERPVSVRVIGKLRMQWLRWRHGKRSAERTREYFR